MLSFAVITPTVGSEYLRQNILSLRGQDCAHYIVVDGREHWEKVNKLLMSPGGPGLSQQERFISLDQNVGKGWYGHRVYAASSFLVNEDVLCYLDEDNWVEPNFIQAFREVFQDPKYQWAYTLRNVATPDGIVQCPDNCESLGNWPVVFDSQRHHIDTGCFAIPRSLAVQVGHHWYGQWGADRQFYAAVKAAAPDYGCTMQHTLNYRLGSETSRATLKMFQEGNRLAQQCYMDKEKYPWHTLRRKKELKLIYQTMIPTIPNIHL